MLEVRDEILLETTGGDHQLSLQDGLLLSELVSRPANATATASK
jgi:hypothetical protein